MREFMTEYKKRLALLVVTCLAVCIANARTSENIINIDMIGFPGDYIYDTVYLDVSAVEKSFDKLAKTPIDDGGLYGYGQASSGIGVSILSIFDSKRFCDCEVCSYKHKVKKYVLGGGIQFGAAANMAVSAKGDFYFGRSFVNSSIVKILFMGVAEFSFARKEYSTDSKSIELKRFGPALGAEFDIMLTPIKTAEEDKQFYFTFGLRGMVGYSILQGVQIENPKVLYATIKPRVSVGFGF